MHSFSRTELLIGVEGLSKLRSSKVAVFGIGGVGSFAVEALARSGVGNIVMVDHDDICLTNINRQIHATSKTVGRPKVEVMKERILEINPQATVIAHRRLYNADSAEELLEGEWDYVIDAIDMVSSKIDLIVRCKREGIRIISSMGAGNKMDPTLLRVADIYQTSICPLARVMRGELRKRGVQSLKVVYSIEKPIKPGDERAAGDSGEGTCPGGETGHALRRRMPGSVAFVPSAAGLLISAEVVKELIGYPCSS